MHARHLIPADPLPARQQPFAHVVLDRGRGDAGSGAELSDAHWSAAVTLRVYLVLFILVQIPLLDPVYGGDFEGLFAVAYTASAVASFVFNWLFMEMYLRRREAKAAVGANSA